MAGNKVNFTQIIFEIEDVVSNSFLISDTVETKSHLEKVLMSKMNVEV